MSNRVEGFVILSFLAFLVFGFIYLCVNAEALKEPCAKACYPYKPIVTVRCECDMTIKVINLEKVK